MTTPQDIHNLWLEIATKDVGLKIGTNENERHLLAQMLYRVRGELRDPTFDNFVVLMPVDPSTEVWVMRKGVEKGLERYKDKQ